MLKIKKYEMGPSGSLLKNHHTLLENHHSTGDQESPSPTAYPYNQLIIHRL